MDSKLCVLESPNRLSSVGSLVDGPSVLNIYPKGLCRDEHKKNTPYLSFGDVMVDETETNLLIIRNHGKSPEVLDIHDKSRLENIGFTFSERESLFLSSPTYEDGNNNQLVIKGNGEIIMVIEWHPQKVCTVSEKVLVTSESRGKYYFYVFGNSVNYKKYSIPFTPIKIDFETNVQRKRPFKEDHGNDSSNRCVVSPHVFFRENTHVSQKSTDVYMEKQEMVFKNWINYELHQRNKTPETFFDMLNHEGEYKTYDIYTFDDFLTIASDIYNSKEVRVLESRLHYELASCRINLRPSIDFMFDILSRQYMAKLLLSYNGFWLGLVLEVMSISCDRKTKFTENDINLLIFGNIKKMFRQNDKNQNKNGGALNYHQCIVKGVLMMVVILDRLKVGHMIEKDIGLFDEKSRVSSSHSLVNDICNKLFVEPNSLKILGSIGYQVRYVQRFTDGSHNVIKSLARDIEDGVFLAKLLECITDERGVITDMLKDPKQSGSTGSLKSDAKVGQICLQNMNQVFKYMEDRGFLPQKLGINSVDIVNGHREKTLKFLWKVLCAWKLSSLVPIVSLTDEVNLLYENTDKSRLSKMPSHIRFDEEKHYLEPAYDDTYNKNYISLIFEWVWLIVMNQTDVSIRGFSCDFSDCSILCCILFHYHPELFVGNRYATFKDVKYIADANRIDYRDMFLEISSKTLQIPRLLGCITTLPRDRQDEDVIIFLLICIFLQIPIRKINAWKAIQRIYAERCNFTPRDPIHFLKSYAIFSLWRCRRTYLTYRNNKTQH